MKSKKIQLFVLITLFIGLSSVAYGKAEISIVSFQPNEKSNFHFWDYTALIGYLVFIT